MRSRGESNIQDHGFSREDFDRIVIPKAAIGQLQLVTMPRYYMCKQPDMSR